MVEYAGDRPIELEKASQYDEGAYVIGGPCWRPSPYTDLGGAASQAAVLYFAEAPWLQNMIFSVVSAD
jgi:hypothetical protein